MQIYCQHWKKLGWHLLSTFPSIFIFSTALRFQNSVKSSLMVTQFFILQSSWCSCLVLKDLGKILVWSDWALASGAYALHQSRLAVLYTGTLGTLITSFTKMWCSSSHCEMEGGIKQSCNGDAQGISRIFTGNSKNFNKTEQLTWILGFGFFFWSPHICLRAGMYNAFSA